MKMKTLTAGVFILLCTLLKIAPSQAAIQGEQAVLRALRTGNYVQDDEIKLKVPDTFENRCLIPIEVSAARTFNRGIQIYIVDNDKNISALFTPLEDGIGSILTRIKMMSAQEVNSITVVLVDNKGIYHVVSKRHIKATLGALKYPCSNPPSATDNQVSTPELKVRTFDDGVRISARVKSPQSSTIFIDKFDFEVDGVKALEAKATPTLATNPIIGFTIKQMVTKADLDVVTSNGQHIIATAERDGSSSSSGSNAEADSKGIHPIRDFVSTHQNNGAGGFLSFEGTVLVPGAMHCIEGSVKQLPGTQGDPWRYAVFNSCKDIDVYIHFCPVLAGTNSCSRESSTRYYSGAAIRHLESGVLEFGYDPRKSGEADGIIYGVCPLYFDQRSLTPTISPSSGRRSGENERDGVTGVWGYFDAPLSLKSIFYCAFTDLKNGLDEKRAKLWGLPPIKIRVIKPIHLRNLEHN